MNLWECEAPGCKSKAVGSGSAMGLRAIGWWFLPGPRLFCPYHRPDAIPCMESGENFGNPCPQCTSEIEAYKWQAIIGQEYGVMIQPYHREEARG